MMRTKLAAVLTAATLPFAVAVPAMAQPTPSPDHRVTTVAPATTLSDYSGEQLFRGLFLDEGPVAQRFPSLSNVLTQSSVAPETARALVKAMRARDPKVFTQLRAAISSADRDRISLALQRVGHALDKVEHTRGTSPDMMPIIRFVAVAVDVVAVAIAVVVVFICFVGTPGANGGGKTVGFERWVDQIARNA